MRGNRSHGGCELSKRADLAPLRQLAAGLRAAIDAFDVAESVAPDRHPNGCDCGRCVGVAELRACTRDIELGLAEIERELEPETERELELDG